MLSSIVNSEAGACMKEGPASLARDRALRIDNRIREPLWNRVNGCRMRDSLEPGGPCSGREDEGPVQAEDG
jgi:hypothetical protein